MCACVCSDRVRVVDARVREEKAKRRAARRAGGGGGGDGDDEELETEEDEEREYMQRCDAGLMALQLIDYTLIELLLAGVPSVFTHYTLPTLTPLLPWSSSPSIFFDSPSPFL